MAASYEHTLDIFPSERKAAIEQVDRAAAAQVKAAIDQSAAAIAVERKAAVEQVGKELSQRMTEVIDRLGKQVDAQSKRSIDQAAAVIADERTRVLVDAEAASQRVVDRIALRLLLAIVAGVIFGGCVALAYRWITTRSRGKGEVEAHVEQEDPAHASVRTA
jgi:sensor c-di-GMP phosphodiesterase-like protein